MELVFWIQLFELPTCCSSFFLIGNQLNFHFLYRDDFLRQHEWPWFVGENQFIPLSEFDTTQNPDSTRAYFLLIALYIINTRYCIWHWTLNNINGYVYILFYLLVLSQDQHKYITKPDFCALQFIWECRVYHAFLYKFLCDRNSFHFYELAVLYAFSLSK